MLFKPASYSFRQSDGTWKEATIPGKECSDCKVPIITYRNQNSKHRQTRCTDCQIKYRKQYKELNHGKEIEYTKTSKLWKYTPKWANRKLMQDIYMKATEKTRSTGILYVVDHIVPIEGASVSGLHVETNLRVITETQNMAKGSKFSEELLARILNSKS